MQIGLLGPITVENGACEIAFNAAKERSLLATLALSPGTVVSFDRLIDALWGELAPPSARKTLQTYVSNVRRALGSDVIATDSAGYTLCVGSEAVDLGRFRELVRVGEDALRAGEPDEAREKLAAAIALWRGEPFGGVAAHTGLAAEAVRLREEFVSALEARVAADLASGRDRELIGELEVLVREHPYRERLWGQLMLALYSGGRQADALAAYERARLLLRDDLGLEPGGELRRIERAILDRTPLADSSPATAPSNAGNDLFRSTIRYARTDDGVHVAYQIVGDGPVDILAVPGFVSHLDMWWDAPTDGLVRRLASFSRVILFDKRGMGLSDRPEHIEVEDWVEDALAVLRAAGSERAVILGISAGVPTATLLAAQHPELTRALLLYGGYARFLNGDDYQLGFDADVVDAFIDDMRERWGTGVGISLLAPSRAEDPAAQRFWARLQTTSASPNAAAIFLRALARIDVRHALPAISTPTLILHAERDQNVPIEAARLSRDLIPGAELVELDTDIHLIWLSDRIDEIGSEIEAFVARTIPDSRNVDTRVATILAAATHDAGATQHHTRGLEAVVANVGGRMLNASGTAVFDGAARAIRCAQTLISESVTERLAVHCGECQVTNNDLRGIAIDLTRQLATMADPGQILVSRTIRDLLLGSTIALVPYGNRFFEGVGDLDVFAVAE